MIGRAGAAQEVGGQTQTKTLSSSAHPHITMPRLLLFCLLVLCVPVAHAQNSESNPYPRTPPETRFEAHAQRQHLNTASLVQNVPLRSIGPTVMSGRVTDVDVSPIDPTHFYIAYASGGLWVTRNNGQSFSPVFDDQAVMTIGDIAVDWHNGERIWVGTGENNSSRSSYAGTGVYTSADTGRTWTFAGLGDMQHTGRIILHPEDPNTVWVAAMGPLYSAGGERGVYKTSDGGQTWAQTLSGNENSGAIDLVIDPSNPQVLYAAMWERTRRAWDFVEGGEASGIYKSTDGGETWTLLSTEGSGFPVGADVGRIGLTVYAGNPQTLYALLDNQARRPAEEPDDDEPVLTREKLQTMTREQFIAVAEADLKDYLDRNGFPAAYTAQSVLEDVREGRIAPVALVEFLEDANAELFDTPVIGAEVYRSDDGGQTWRRTHEDFLDNVYYSYGYYFGEIRVAPHDPERIYIMGVPILRSDDGGQTWKNINKQNVHVDHHALWVSPDRPGHLINGNDGGLNVSYDDGETWFKANTPPVGQFYTVQYDMAQPYRVYGGMQDNGVWKGPSNYDFSYSWYEEGKYPYERLGGGDGMQVEVDTRNNDVVYWGYQFGFYSRINTDTGERVFVRPQHKLGERPFRFNWQTPIHLSRHNQDVLYFGSNRFHRSLDGGRTFENLSDDLTKGGQPGNVPYGTLSSIDESPLRFGLLYAGSDDGLMHVSRDGGFTWSRISDALPPDLWVSRVEASHHAEGRVYVTLNGYRWDHMDAYVYRSDDYGQTWTRIGTDLPAEPVNVITEDPENADLLYVGTDHGLYASLDRGQSFMAMMHGMPHAPVHDIKVHPREKHLLVGTHGRSLYRADVAHVQQLDAEMLARPLHAFPISPVTTRSNWGETATLWGQPSTPEVTIPYFAGTSGQATIRVKAPDGTVLREWTDAAERGLNYVTYDVSADADRLRRYAQRADFKEADNGVWYLIPATYTVEVTLGGATVTAPLEVKPIPPRGRRALPAPVPLPGEKEPLRRVR